MYKDDKLTVDEESSFDNLTQLVSVSSRNVISIIQGLLYTKAASAW